MIPVRNAKHHGTWLTEIMMTLTSVDRGNRTVSDSHFSAPKSAMQHPVHSEYPATRSAGSGRVGPAQALDLTRYAIEISAVLNLGAPLFRVNPVHPGGEEILMLEGVFRDEDGVYPAAAGCAIRAGAATRRLPEQKAR